MPFNSLLILPLLGGFFFIQFAPRFRFYFQKLDGYSLLLSASFFGVLFVGVARVLVFLAAQHPLPWVKGSRRSRRAFSRSPGLARARVRSPWG